MAPPVPKDAILVVGDADDLGEGEEDLIQTLERALLFNLVSIADDADLARDFDQGLVVISSSVNAATLNDEWLNERVPVVVMDDEMFPEMEMTDDGDNDVEQEDTVEIEEDAHPIVAEFRGQDEIEVSDNNIAMAIGDPDGDGRVIASAGNSNDGAIFVYEYNDTLAEVDNEDAGIARHRRVGFFVAENDILDLNADGQTLLENALLYAWSGSVENR